MELRCITLPKLQHTKGLKPLVSTVAAIPGPPTQQLPSFQTHLSSVPDTLFIGESKPFPSVSYKCQAKRSQSVTAKLTF